MFELIYTLNGEERRQPLAEGVTIIGRSGQADVVVGDKSVSGQHARLERRGDEVTVTDLGSSNGTRVNGQKVESAALHAGDELRLGRVQMRVEGGAPAADRSETPPLVDATRPDETPPAGSQVPAAAGEGGGAVMVLPPQNGGGAGGAPGAARRKKLILAAAAVLVVGLVAVFALAPEEGPPPRPHYGTPAYNEDLRRGAEALAEGRYAAAAETFTEAAEQWDRDNPNSPRTAARRLARLTAVLARAAAQDALAEVDWYEVERQADDFLDELSNIPDPVQSAVRQLEHDAAISGQERQVLQEAHEAFDRGDYQEAEAIAARVEETGIYGEAAATLAEEARSRRLTALRRRATTSADRQDWAAAIQAGQEYLSQTADPAFEKKMSDWRRLQDEQRTLRRARAAFEEEERASLIEAKGLAESIPEESPYHERARQLLNTIAVKLEDMRIQTLWQAYNVPGLKRMAEEDPTIRDNPLYSNTMKRIADIQALFERGDQLYGEGEYDAARQAWEQITDIVRDRDHPAYRQARQKMLSASPSKLREKYLEDAREALKDGRYAAARAAFAKAAEKGAEVEEELAPLFNRAGLLYNRARNKSSRLGRVEGLKEALECVLPGDPWYDRIVEALEEEGVSL
jgi:hypothetical protein